MKPNGIILYEGKSKIDNGPIVAIVTGTARKSQNGKTGNGMLQTWIMRSDVNPIASLTTGKDYSVCGNCKHRRYKTCYVNRGKAAYQVFKAYENNKYVKLDCYNIDLIKGKKIRLGSIGDPYAVPIEVWENLTKFVSEFTGYTHQYRKSDDLKDYCMASCDTLEEKKIAEQKGYRTFRIRLDNESILKNEIQCPASEESGRKSSCDKCGMCNGLSNNSHKNIVIRVHGQSKNRYTKIMILKKNHKKFSHLV